MTTFQLAPHQQIAHDFLVSRPRAGLFLGIGSGKTLTTLAALMTIKPVGHILVLAPDAIARTTWVNEIRKHKIPVRIKNLTYSEKDKKYTPAQRRKAFETIYTDPPTFYFMSNNSTLIGQLVDFCAQRSKETGHPNPFPFGTVILDESQEFKNPSSQRFKHLKKVSPYISRMILLTGSPQPNSLEDLWSQVYLLDGGRALGPNITAFRSTYMQVAQMANGIPIKYKPTAGAEQTVHQRIKHLVMSSLNYDLGVPDKLDVTVPIYMDDTILDGYKELARESLITAIISENDGVSEEDLRAGLHNLPVTISSESAAALRMKLLQYASGTLYIDKEGIEDYTDSATAATGTRPYLLIHKEKLEATQHIVDRAQSPVLIAYRFRSEKDALIKHLTEQGYQVESFDGSQDMMSRWNSRQIPVMLLQPASFKHGINIQDGGHHLIWFSLPDSLEAYEQTIGRLYRRGQRDTVYVHHLITQETEDTKQMPRLTRKQYAQDGLMEAVNRDITSLAQAFNLSLNIT